MFNSLLLWCKENYEKVILGILVVLLIVTGAIVLSGVNREKELESFKVEVQPPIRPIRYDPIDIPDLNGYIKEKPKIYYQPIEIRDIFSPEKKSVVTTPDMNLECIGVTSASTGDLIAALRNRRTNTTYNVKAGEQVENFIVVSVSREVVIISSEERQYRLKPPTITMPFKLTGILPTATGEKEAMLQNEITRKSYFVKIGDKIENWEVLSISENTVIISKSDAGKYELRTGGESKRIQE